MKLLLPLVPLLFFAQFAPAQPPRATASLLADVAAIQAGAPFQIGALLEIQPGWHVYWRNPGEGGVPTELELTLPPGFTASEVRFPLPQRFIQPGNIIGYGYKEQVMLLVEITPPPDLPADSQVAIGAEVSWLACDPSVCIPGEQRLSLTLPVSDRNRPANREIFERWNAELPRQWSGETLVVELRRSEDGRSAIVTTILSAPAAQAEPPLRDGEVFVDAPPTLLVDEVQLAGEALTMRLRPVPENDLIMKLLIVYTDDDDRREGIEVPLRLPAPE